MPSEKGLCAVAVCMTDGQLAGKNEDRLGTPSEGVVSQGKARFRQTLEESGRQLVQRRLAFTHEHPRHFELVRDSNDLFDITLMVMIETE